MGHLVRHALVTGATGFIGRHLVDRLHSRHVQVTVLTRTPELAASVWPGGSVRVHQGDLSNSQLDPNLCLGCDTVFHLAGYAHADDADTAGAETVHRAVTVEGTRALLDAAVKSHVSRFIFASSVKAMGEGAAGCLDETAPDMPTSHYGRAKREAEQLVLASGRRAGMHTAVLRLPLVYGHGNKGNVPRMIAAIGHGYFPPVPEVQNRRSMVHVVDVVQALLLAAERPDANGNVYNVTDGRAYSTREIYVAICCALDRKVPGWSVPAWLLRLGARAGDALGWISGRRMSLSSVSLEKLLGSAWYSSDKIRRELGYVSHHSFYDALPEMVAEYRGSRPGANQNPSDA